MGKIKLFAVAAPLIATNFGVWAPSPTNVRRGNLLIVTSVTAIRDLLS
jgi:hypothetical protein